VNGSIKLPLFLIPVVAGFPSPAEDFVETNLDLNDYLITKPAATYYLRVKGDSMMNLSINDGDLLVVDRSIAPSNNSIVIASINGDFTVKIYEKNKTGIRLLPANDHYKPICVSSSDEFTVWGVVKHVIHTFQR
jgi:DNA polymerase V